MPGLPLAVRGLQLSFDAVSVIALDALDVAPGSFIALSGPSGSGKSTLLYLLSGLLHPDAGQVAWGQTDLSSLRESARDRWRRDNAGFIFQDFHLIAEMSPLNNVLAPALFGHFSSRPFRDAARDRLQMLGVPLERRRASLLSRGEQQRVAMARALLFNPPVVFADEPTASLDAPTGRDVVAVLRRLATQERRTVIAASHDPALLDQADLIIRLDHGRPVDTGLTPT